MEMGFFPPPVCLEESESINVVLTCLWDTHRALPWHRDVWVVKKKTWRKWKQEPGCVQLVGILRDGATTAAAASLHFPSAYSWVAPL